AQTSKPAPSSSRRISRSRSGSSSTVRTLRQDRSSKAVGFSGKLCLPQDRAIVSQGGLFPVMRLVIFRPQTHSLLSIMERPALSRILFVEDDSDIQIVAS